jgi:hypothetical protein
MKLRLRPLYVSVVRRHFKTCSGWVSGEWEYRMSQKPPHKGCVQTLGPVYPAETRFPSRQN